MGTFEIVPGTGIGPVRFGQTPTEAESALGEPRLYEEWMGGNLNDSLCFRGLILTFDCCGSMEPPRRSRLVEVQIHGRADAHLFGRPAFEWTRDRLLAILRRQSRRVAERGFGDVRAEELGLRVSFDDRGRLDWIELRKPARALWPRLKGSTEGTGRATGGPGRS